MPSRDNLTASSPWVELRPLADDWDAADPGSLLRMLGYGLWIRAFEEYVLELAGEGLVHGPAHSSIGQEGGAIGSVLETFNLAAAWRLPLCFFIENNQYAVSTPVREATAEPRLSARGAAFNIPSWRVDGMDPLAVNLAMNEALDHMRAGNGPTIIE